MASSSSSASKEASKTFWGKLLSEHSQNPRLDMSDSVITVGSSRDCYLVIDREDIADVLCRLSPLLDVNGVSSVLLEIIGGKCVVQVNDKIYQKNERLTVREGDELIFDHPYGKHAYIFQQTVLPVGMSQAHIKEVEMTKRRRQEFKDCLQQQIFNPEVSFKSFPYYLSDTTKNALTTSTYIHLKCNGFGKYASDLLSSLQRILLSGPTGSEIYQVTLSKALAKHFGARLLIVDSLSLPGEVDTSRKSSRLVDLKKSSPASSKGAILKAGDQRNACLPGHGSPCF